LGERLGRGKKDKWVTLSEKRLVKVYANL